VEDHEINLQVAQEILESAMLKVHSCSNGHDAVLEVNRNMYDVVIMDIHMPIMDGLQASRLIREKFDGKTLPIIALSAAAMLDDQKKCLDAGMNGYVSKPIKKINLFNALLKHINPRVGIGIKLSRDPLLAPRHETPLFHGDIPGIDLEECQMRYEGKRDLFLTILKQFKSKYSDAGEKIRSALQIDDLATAREWAHSIAGISGNMAARKLYETSLAVETAILEKRRENWPKLLDQFDLLLQQLSESISMIISNNDNIQSEIPLTEDVDRDLLISTVFMLGESINKYEYNARKYLASLKVMVKDMELRKILDDMQDLLDRVNYKGAALSYDSLVTAMGLDRTAML